MTFEDILQELHDAPIHLNTTACVYMWDEAFQYEILSPCANRLQGAVLCAVLQNAHPTRVTFLDDDDTFLPTSFTIRHGILR